MDQNVQEVQNQSLTTKRNELLSEIDKAQKNLDTIREETAIALGNKTAALVEEAEIRGAMAALRSHHADLINHLPEDIVRLDAMKQSLGDQIGMRVDTIGLLDNQIGTLKELADSIAVVNDTIKVDQQKVRQYLNVMEVASTSFDSKVERHIQTIKDFAEKVISIYQDERKKNDDYRVELDNRERNIATREILISQKVSELQQQILANA